MAILYEHYTVAHNDTTSIYGNEPGHWKHWAGQTFTPKITHKIKFVRLSGGVSNQGAGDLTVEIRTTDGNGFPTEDILCSGIFSGLDLPYFGVKWIKVEFTTKVELIMGTKYAIVCHADDRNASLAFKWRDVASNATYVGGNLIYNNSPGGGDVGYWDILGGDYDMIFEEWGVGSKKWKNDPKGVTWSW